MNHPLKLIIILMIFIQSLSASTELKNITLQLSWFNQFQFAGYYIAKEKGFYKEAGLEVKIKPFEFGIDIPNEVSNGKYDFAVGREALILDRSKHKNIVALYALFQASPLVLLTTKESKINSIADFKNKRIMTTIANASEVSLKAMLKSKNINLKDLNFLKHTHNINDLITKKTDIISAYTSKSPFILQKKGISYNIFEPKEYGFDMYSDFLFTSESNINNDLEKVLKFKKASLKGWEYAYSNIEESVELILSKYNTQNLSEAELIFEGQELRKLSYYETDTLGNIDLSKLQRIYDLYNVMGLINTKVEIKNFVLLEDNFSLFLKEVLNNLSKYIDLPYIYFFIILFFLLIILIVYKQLKLAEKHAELIKSKRKLDEVFEASGEGIWDWNIQTDYVEHNHTWYHILGLDSTNDSNKDFTTLIHPDDKKNVLKKIKDTMDGKNIAYQSEHRLFRSNGNIVWVIDKGRIVEWDKNGNPLRMAGSFSDITERKESEKKVEEQQIKLVNSEKMASLGEMIGNIAHQWRQPLSAITTGASGLQVSKEFGTLTNQEIETSCTIINNNAQYLSKIINYFSDFIKKDKEIVQFNLQDNINSFLHIVEGTIKKNEINIIKDIRNDIIIKGYPNELIQCFINIFNNAKDAFTNNDENKYLFISSYINNERVIISVKDNGNGIQEDVLSKVFEAYFTTKHKSQGTGLGLTMTYRLIVESMKGTIEANNVEFEHDGKEYTGAEFKISLPIS